MKLARAIISLTALTTIISCASVSKSQRQTFSENKNLNRSVATSTHPSIKADPGFCPSYAPTSGSEACDPNEVATEINGLIHPVDWMGSADPSWAFQHNACTTTENLDHLGEELGNYSALSLGYWARGVFYTLRVNNPEFWNKRRAMIQDFFSSTLIDPEVQNQCCRGSAACLSSFNSTKLVFSDDKPDEYDPNLGAVVLNTSRDISEIYDEILKQLIIHELGYACDQSMYNAENPNHPTKIDGTQAVSQENAHIQSRIGSTFLDCLQNYAQKDTGGPLEGHNGAEAFAQSIFSFRFKQALDWTGLAAAKSGYSWGLKCVLELPELKTKACAE